MLGFGAQPWATGKQFLDSCCEINSENYEENNHRRKVLRARLSISKSHSGSSTHVKFSGASVTDLLAFHYYLAKK